MSVELLRELGRGGMATVYLGRDRQFGREVAVKVLHENLLTDDEAMARFEHEARVVARFEHPNILGLYGLEELEGGPLGLVMPYVRGGTLAERFERTKGGLPVEEVVSITRAVLQGLDYAHNRGVVHRDVKPGNIFLGEQTDLVLIADFGIARAAGAQTAPTQTGASMGTPNYMAPEQIDSVSDVDGRADLYAVGMMMWEMLTGERPWSNETPFNVIFKQKTEDLESPKIRRPEIPDALIQVWRTALRKDPEDRWPSAEAMLEALGAVGGKNRSSPVGNAAASPPGEGEKKIDRAMSRPHAASNPEVVSSREAEVTKRLGSKPRSSSQPHTVAAHAPPRKRKEGWGPIHSTVATVTLLIVGGVVLMSGDTSPDSSGPGSPHPVPSGATVPGPPSAPQESPEASDRMQSSPPSQAGGFPGALSESSISADSSPAPPPDLPLLGSAAGRDPEPGWESAVALAAVELLEWSGGQRSRMIEAARRWGIYPGPEREPSYKHVWAQKLDVDEEEEETWVVSLPLREVRCIDGNCEAVDHDGDRLVSWMSTPSVILFLGRRAGTFHLLEVQESQAFSSSVHRGAALEHVGDLTGDGRSEIVIREWGFGASFVSLFWRIGTWEGGSWHSYGTLRVAYSPDEPAPALSIIQAENQEAELHLPGSFIPSVGAGLQRSSTSVYRFNGSTFQLDESLPSPSDHPYFLVVDANRALEDGRLSAGYQLAGSALRQLEGDEDFWNVDQWAHPRIAGLAHFQQMLASGASGDMVAVQRSRQAASHLEESPFREAVILLFEAFERTGDIRSACQEAGAFLAKQPDDASEAEEASLLSSFGYRTERLLGYCPWSS